MLISEDYRQQNRTLHETNPNYGTSGRKYVGIVREMSEGLQTADILDYGCGKGTLKEALGFDIREYDPAIPGKDQAPQPADIVVCTDVLEHIEPECIDDLLSDLARLTKRVAFVTVAVVPAKKHLPDGRNAHILLKPVDWWMREFDKHFMWLSLRNEGHSFIAYLSPKLGRKR